MTDAIKNPPHYQIKPGVEVIDVREWWIREANDSEIGVDPVVINRLDRAIEYLLRAPNKNGTEDVRKAYQYLHRALHGEWPAPGNCDIAESEQCTNTTT